VPKLADYPVSTMQQINNNSAATMWLV